MTAGLRNFLCVAMLSVLAGCTGQPIKEAEPFDFDGVFDDTIAGTIDRSRQSARPDGPPNIVLIIADDLGWPYLGFLGNENVMTPNLDMIGREGTVFELGHASSNYCRPTLQTLMTGLYPVQYANKANAIAEKRLSNDPEADDLNSRDRNLLLRQYETSAIEEFDTLPRLLADRRYISHQSGKWWEQSYAHGGFTHGMTESWSWQDAAGLGDRWFFTFMGGHGNDIGRKTMAPVTRQWRQKYEMDES